MMFIPFEIQNWETVFNNQKAVLAPCDNPAGVLISKNDGKVILEICYTAGNKEKSFSYPMENGLVWLGNNSGRIMKIMTKNMDYAIDAVIEASNIVQVPPGAKMNHEALICYLSQQNWKL